jgi:hypothetical protein
MTEEQSTGGNQRPATQSDVLWAGTTFLLGLVVWANIKASDAWLEWSDLKRWGVNIALIVAWFLLNQGAVGTGEGES